MVMCGRSRNSLTERASNPVWTALYKPVMKSECSRKLNHQPPVFLLRRTLPNLARRNYGTQRFH
jgi:hypothetical protein